MTKDETLVIMGILQTAYPQFYRGMQTAQAEHTAALWAEMFANDPVEVVKMAVKSFICTDTKGFPPHIGIIKSHVAKVTQAPQLSELEAWNAVKKALSNSSYHAQEAFDQLPLTVQRIVGSPAQLREWAMFDAERLDSVIGSNFQRSYKGVSTQQQEQQLLPPALSQLVKRLAGDTHTTQAPVLPSCSSAHTQPPQQQNSPALSPEDFEAKRAFVLQQLRVDIAALSCAVERVAI